MNWNRLFLAFLLFATFGHASTLERLTPPNSAVLIVSIDSGTILDSAHAELLNKSYPPGSLMKVFTAIAFHQEHGEDFPTLQCPATLASDPKGCWDRNGHGEVGIVKAIGYSCNVYFRQLAQRTSHKIFQETLTRFDLHNDEPIADISSLMVGSTVTWTIAPARLLRAYSSFYNGGHLYAYRSSPAKHVSIPEPVRKIIHQGMKLSAEKGTSVEAKTQSGQPIAGKTGTSLLWTNGKANWRETQGYWIGMHPADQPKIAILTFVPKGRGATDAAPLGGKALAQYLLSKRK